MSRDYYIHKRPNGIFYVQFVNPENGKLMTARSTEKTDRIDAEVQAKIWLTNGLPTGKHKEPKPIIEMASIDSINRAIRKADLTSDDAMQIVDTLKSMGLIDVSAVKNTGRGAEPFIQYLETFWDYDKSEYIQDRLAHGYRFTRTHAHECQKRLSRDIKPFFGDIKMNAVTTDDLKRLTRYLSDRGLATSTRYQALLICCTPLKWAYNQKYISANPCLGLSRIKITYEERGILTDAEAAAIFSVQWNDKRAFVASLVACTTGARQGEVLALRLNDIRDDILNIAHSYSSLDGLKCPKNEQKRDVPLLPIVKDALLDLLKDNPYDEPNPFIFYSFRPDKPTHPQVILMGLKDALKKINVDYKSRKIVFHSWRHFFCSKITELIDGEKVAKVSGHLSEAVFKKYASHIERKNVREVGNAAAQAFGSILQFNKAG